MLTLAPVSDDDFAAIRAETRAETIYTEPGLHVWLAQHPDDGPVLLLSHSGGHVIARAANDPLPVDADDDVRFLGPADPASWSGFDAAALAATPTSAIYLDRTTYRATITALAAVVAGAAITAIAELRPGLPLETLARITASLSATICDALPAVLGELADIWPDSCRDAAA